MNILSILNKTLYLDFISYLFPPSFYFARTLPKYKFYLYLQSYKS